MDNTDIDIETKSKAARDYLRNVFEVYLVDRQDLNKIRQLCLDKTLSPREVAKKFIEGGNI